MARSRWEDEDDFDEDALEEEGELDEDIELPDEVLDDLGLDEDYTSVDDASWDVDPGWRQSAEEADDWG